MAKTSIIIPLFCVYTIYSDMHRVNASPWTYPPFPHCLIRLLKEICGSLSLHARNLSVPLNVFAPNVLSEGVCQAEDNPSCDVTIEA